ncbi:uncharacterized protein UMAG_12202 [Mycosarcoma maydis]|uniref:Uncharacterized protein n=1 Tax=Mycosarcoma maydis TaxID=5270 RepID=A0A0D1DY10_MYCMD|nr:uncharacterized protein UMAG_12202 [Ustilago maydis 521]KIS68994.1 hypothetical protein UMAG_12202 [Ustilago maydis 521]|eukprot:XP_011389581.1 hypothetical protein UMAG_12202 [Ustilago maydis 521]
MEAFLGIVFPCCFSSRRRSSLSGTSESTPLLHDALHATASCSHSVCDHGVPTIQADARRKRKQNSVLPTPAYDAVVLRDIMDEFLSKLISVDASARGVAGTGEKRARIRTNLLSTLEDRVAPSKAKHVTPIHTLGPTLSRSSTHAHEPKFVDIWCDHDSSAPPRTACAPTTGAHRLNYSAAAKRAALISPPPSKKPLQKRPPPPHPKPSLDDPTIIQQSTYESLSLLARSKPLVHDWTLADHDPQSST